MERHSAGRCSPPTDTEDRKLTGILKKPRPADVTSTSTVTSLLDDVTDDVLQGVSGVSEDEAEPELPEPELPEPELPEPGMAEEEEEMEEEEDAAEEEEDDATGGSLGRQQAEVKAG